MEVDNNLSDEVIARQVQEGNAEIFGLFVERYEKKMLRYASRFSSNGSDRQDAIQDVFLKAYQNIRSFDTNRKFSTWLYRIAHNELINRLKKKSAIPFSFLETDIFFPHPVSKNYFKEIENRLLREELEKHMDQIPDKYREALYLFYFEEMDYQEISDILEIPVSTVGVRLARAREKLKSIYFQNSKRP